MRFLRFVVVATICVLGLSLLAGAGQNKFGISDNRTIAFTSPVRIGEVLLPSGDYSVRHIMDGANHIMIFKQLSAAKPMEARVKCDLVPLKKKANRTEQTFQMNAANERVLHTLVFAGDTAQHVF